MIFDLIYNIFILLINILGGIYNGILYVVCPKKSRRRIRFYKKKHYRSLKR